MKIIQHFKAPNPDDIATIEDLLNSVSWAEECVFCQQVGRDRLWLNVSNEYVLVPVACEDYPDNLDEVFLAGKTLGLAPGAIFYGDPTNYRRDEINYEAYKAGIIVYWVGAKNRLAHSKFLFDFPQLVTQDSK